MGSSQCNQPEGNEYKHANAAVLFWNIWKPYGKFNTYVAKCPAYKLLSQLGNFAQNLKGLFLTMFGQRSLP